VIRIGDLLVEGRRPACEQLSASSDFEPGSAVYTTIVKPGSPTSSIDSCVKITSIVPNAGHVDLYDKTHLIPFDKLDVFFTDHVSPASSHAAGQLVGSKS
jgi:hypothetical protein